MSSESSNLVSDIKEIPVSAISRHMVYAINAKKPAFFWSSPGLGKSEIVRSVAKLLGYHIEDVRLSQIDAIDLRGLPVKSYTSFNINKDGAIIDEKPASVATVEWAMPDFLVRAKKAREMHNQNTIFFFDELNHADDTNQSAAYQFILEGQVGCFKIQEGDRVFAAGNFENEGSIANPMSMALSNRMIHYYVSHDVQAWLDWAMENEIHPILIAYVHRNKDTFVDRISDIEEDYGATKNKAFKTPRTLKYASDMMWSILGSKTKDGRNKVIDRLRSSVPSIIDSNSSVDVKSKLDKLFPSFTQDDFDYDLSVALAGCVGPANADNIMTYVRFGQYVPDPIDILEGKVTKYDSDKNSIDIQSVTSNQCISIIYGQYKKVLKLSLAKNGTEVIDFRMADPEIKKEIEILYNYFENFFWFANSQFSADLLIFAFVTTLIRGMGIQPMPHLFKNDKTFDTLFEKTMNSTSEAFND